MISRNMSSLSSKGFEYVYHTEQKMFVYKPGFIFTLNMLGSFLLKVNEPFHAIDFSEPLDNYCVID